MAILLDHLLLLPFPIFNAPPLLCYLRRMGLGALSWTSHLVTAHQLMTAFQRQTLHYATLDQALALVACYGPNALMAKLDIKHAFRLCPVRIEDRELLGIHWQGKFYVDLRLPFSLPSSPYLFNSLADAFEWVLKRQHEIPDLMHYLDDVCVKCPVHHAYSFIPLALDKLESPATQLLFLGIRIDTTAMETSLPKDKLSGLLTELQWWSSSKKCCKRDFLSLICKLNFAYCIIPAGHSFLHCFIDLSCTVRLPHHHLTLNQEACCYIAWWLEFLPTWNGLAIIPDPQWTLSPDLELFSDASGCLGYGIYNMGHWIAQPSPAVLQDRSIQWKELYPIALACLLRGSQWSGRNFCFTVKITLFWIFGPQVHPVTP